MKYLLAFAVLLGPLVAAQGGFVSAGVSGSDIPLLWQYNERSFGVRLSADTPFAGLEGDARLQLFEDGSSFYLSVAVGLRPFSNNPHANS
jgi:hypothetical protein